MAASGVPVLVNDGRWIGGVLTCKHEGFSFMSFGKQSKAKRRINEETTKKHYGGNLQHVQLITVFLDLHFFQQSLVLLTNKGPKPKNEGICICSSLFKT